jgi:hypothetical protein
MFARRGPLRGRTTARLARLAQGPGRLQGPRRKILALTDQNRRHRDPRIDVKLVRARAAALDKLDRNGGPASWPPPARDLFPSFPSPPDIAYADLTPARLAGGIGRHGSIIVRGLISPARAAQLLADTDRAFAARDAYAHGAPVRSTTPWYTPLRPRGEQQPRLARKLAQEWAAVYTAESPATFFDLLESYEEAGLCRLMAAHLGEPPLLALTKSTLRRARADSGSAWHQEAALFGPHVRTCNVWLALTPCGVEAPGLDLAPFRFHSRIITGGTDARFDWTVAPPVAEGLLAGKAAVRPTFAPGDAVLFDEMCLHRTGVEADMPKERCAIESWFFAPSTFPDGWLPLVV